MDYTALLDLAMKLGYRLAMNGAETFRVEDSVSHIMKAYGISAETFAIPNLILINIEAPDGQSYTRMRRIGIHGNDLDAVEIYSNLSRRICAEKPTAEEAIQWVHDADASKRSYKLPIHLAGNFLGAAGFAVFFGGLLTDSLCAGLCGVLVGLVNYFTAKQRVNTFFSTIASAFVLSLAAYLMGILDLAQHTDAVIIGALMILVPGLLFTNAMRDIIFGDTNSGVNRIVQVLLIAVAIAIGAAAAWMLSGMPADSPATAHSAWLQCLAAFIGCLGFAILFNIHGKGMLLCAFGGLVAWGSYCVAFALCGNDAIACFIGAMVASLYAEIMARVRKYPAISYLVVSIFPMLPGAGIYYTANSLFRGDLQNFTDKGMQTIAAAGALAVGILMISTIVRLWYLQKSKALKKKNCR